MAYEDYVPLDRLTHKHESYPYDPTNPELTQVLAVEHGGRTLEVIVPLFDDARIGEVVAAAADGSVLFLLCRYVRPFDDFWGTPPMVVIPSGEIPKSGPLGEGRSSHLQARHSDRPGRKSSGRLPVRGPSTTPRTGPRYTVLLP
jgi:hypothetical protein